MEVTGFVVNVTSENPERLKEFYRDIVGLQPNPDAGEAAFNVNGSMFIIDGHSETKGPAKEPQRVLIDFFVDDLAKEQKRLEEKGVKFFRTAGKEFWGGVISSFTDPDGNYVQLIEFKPPEA
ncbi:MAG TPA: VOC family protein [Dehalococcoidia bacterium]|nr:VOC family protein [Dehalococcoidia bacterium]